MKAAPTPTAHGWRRGRRETALRMHDEGPPNREIACRISASGNSVRRWARTGRFVPYRRAASPSRVDRHLPFVGERWQEGQRIATVLYRELRKRGFTGGYDIVCRWAVRRRAGARVRPPSAGLPSTRRIGALPRRAGAGVGRRGLARLPFSSCAVAIPLA